MGGRTAQFHLDLSLCCEDATGSSLELKCFLQSAEMDTEELEKELDSLLQDSSKDSVDLPPVPQKVLSPPISDAELEAELEKLSVSAGDLAQNTPSAASEPKTALGLNL